MHDSYNVITPKQVNATFFRAILKTILAIGWAFLLYRNIVDNDASLIVGVWGAVCGFFTGYQSHESIKLWRQWQRESKELNRLRDIGETFE